MARRWVALLISMMFAALATGPAAADKRVALIIGNGSYKETDKLINPLNDAADMIAALKRLGFEVLQGIDLDKRGMERVIRQFDLALANADLGLFFYAGHGLQIGGQNYLVPTDARLASEGDVDFESLPLNLILRRMEREAKTSLVLLDACRDNPLARNLARTMGTRGPQVGQGLGEVKTGVGTLIGFSTQPGNVALDGRGRNSPYTAALLKEIETPGRDILTTMAAVRGAVVRETSGKQVPWEHTSLLGPVVLKESKLAEAAPKMAREAPSRVEPEPGRPSRLESARDPTPATTEAERAWTLVKDSTSVGALEAFVRRFGDTFYSDLAQQRIAELKRPAAPPQDQKLALLDTPKAAPKAAPPKDSEPRATVPRAGQQFRDCDDGCPEMVVVPAGSFTMGSPAEQIQDLTRRFPEDKDWWAAEAPAHTVRIARPFAVGKYEVTFAEWERCTVAGACKHKPSDKGWGRGRRPVMNVSWSDAREYVGWLLRKTGQEYRLLTEAEWEYAARAGTSWRYAVGDEITQKQARFSLPPRGSVGSTSEVGAFGANAFGLHDMHGNVREWVEDCYHKSYEGAPADGTAWLAACEVDAGGAVLRVQRGGSWFSLGQGVGSADRFAKPATERADTVGFRVARVLP